MTYYYQRRPLDFQAMSTDELKRRYYSEHADREYDKFRRWRLERISEELRARGLRLRIKIKERDDGRFPR